MHGGSKTGQLLHFGAKLDKLAVASSWGDSGFALSGDLGHRHQKLFSQQLDFFPERLSVLCYRAANLEDEVQIICGQFLYLKTV